MSNKERQAKFKREKKRDGLKRVEYWIPESLKERLKTYVAVLVKGEAKGPKSAHKDD